MILSRNFISGNNICSISCIMMLRVGEDCSDMVFVRFFQVVFELEPAAVGFGRDLRQILKCPWDY